MTRDTLIGTDSIFSNTERKCLSAIAAAMIPANSEQGLPGADDDQIFPRILDRASKIAGAVRACLNAVESASLSRNSAGFVALDMNERVELLQGLHQKSPMLLGPLVGMISASYYEDDRVLESLGHEPRAPFPEGHQLEAGDWSLLDPVRSRQPFYRKV